MRYDSAQMIYVRLRQLLNELRTCCVQLTLVYMGQASGGHPAMEFPRIRNAYGVSCKYLYLCFFGLVPGLLTNTSLIFPHLILHYNATLKPKSYSVLQPLPKR